MKRRRTTQYSLVQELMASPTAPMPEAKSRHQLTRMWAGLDALARDEEPATDAWRCLSDAVNLMETLVAMGEVEDAQGLLMDAITALAEAGKRHRAGQPLRLTGAGMNAVRAVLEDYAEAMAQLPERTMVRCHRRTEKRIQDILAGRSLPHDVEVIGV